MSIIDAVLGLRREEERERVRRLYADTAATYERHARFRAKVLAALGQHAQVRPGQLVDDDAVVERVERLAERAP